ncbi:MULTISPECIES: hypothetical protein [Pseudomonas]|jgi:hypothetical protein|uniref:hypothetical protein n=1 Tax=Pseudomonas TaxID=286 RepID=UPI001C826F24|nr:MULTISPECIES: hypothetical protein [Pseudomonas]MDG9929765.1 hypothetical protein [Pseudomonas sp. GD04042]MDH0485845.1 hypothetical protein [Pseudomonas sp. GD04015]MDH0605973.1 hypothetical protein [Pseudomonas sp. GD03869]MDH0895902.1 hypothetical protein [Pseudomonas sp. GD03875]MDH1065313.1 hypothetical protein [Pseudomonas sp. GD03985]
MRTFSILLICLAGLAAGCSGKAPSTCEVFSPPEIILPSTKDDQRVEAQSTGDPTRDGSAQQDCP